MLEAQEENVAISKKQMASNLLRGGVLNPGRVETVLGVMFGKMHEVEKKNRTSCVVHESYVRPGLSLSTSRSQMIPPWCVTQKRMISGKQ